MTLSRVSIVESFYSPSWSEVILHWPAFLGAILLLWFPPSLWLSQEVKRHLSHERTASQFGLLRGALVWQNWVDLVRAYAGGYLLFNHALEVPEGREWELFAWQAAILMIALLVQTVRRHHKRKYFLAPVFFVWGLTFFIAGPLLALYGIAASALVARVAENLEWKFPVMAAVVAGAGYLLSGLKPLLILNAVLIVFPLIATFCGRGQLVFLMKETPRKKAPR